MKKECHKKLLITLQMSVHIEDCRLHQNEYKELIITLQMRVHTPQHYEYYMINKELINKELITLQMCGHVEDCIHPIIMSIKN